MKTSLDPIIAVKDIRLSSEWYQSLFGFKSLHGGDTFQVLADEEKKVTLCLHKWGEHNHPSMMQRHVPGNGLILYFRTRNMREIHSNAQKINADIVEEIHLNKNSLHNEFSVKDPDGYFIIVSDYHDYEG